MDRLPTLRQKNTGLAEQLPALPSPKRAQLNPAALRKPLVSLVTNPDGTWLAIRDESVSAVALFERYIFLLAAIPAVSGTFGFTAFGYVSIPAGIGYGIVGYILCLAFLYGATYLAHLVAPMFDGSLSLDNSAKLIVYSFMPFFVSGLFLACPPLSFLSLAGLYAIILFFRGVPVLSGVPLPKQFTFFTLNAVCWILYAELMRWSLFGR